MALSHNVYYDESNTTTTYLPKYLILITKDDGTTEISQTNSIMTAIDMAKYTKRICSIYERKGSMGKNWQYLIDMGSNI